MSKLEAALERLGAAVAVLERTAPEAAGTAQDWAALLDERDRLAETVAELQAARAEDAQLRAEAAEAVRAALGDLRALAPEGERADG